MELKKKSRNFCGWQMKSVHSSEAAPYRRPVEQSQGLNEREDNGGGSALNTSLLRAAGTDRQTDGQTAPSVFLPTSPPQSFGRPASPH